MRSARLGSQPGAGRALAWSFANTAVGRFGTLAIGIALARLLGPEEFGTFAVALVALMAILSFNELGVSLAIVRWQDDPADIAPTVTTISVLMSAVLSGLVVLAAPSFAGAMGSPASAPLIQLLGLCILINGVVATPAALMQRFFRQDQRMVADQVNVWLGAVVSLTMALAGFGALSLVVGRLVGASVSGLLLLRFSPLPYRLGFAPEQARLLLRFGLPLAVASVVVFLVGFVDQLMVGKLLGPTQLGVYVLAFNLAMWPVSILSQPLRSVAPALFSRMQHDPDLMRTSFIRVLRPLSAVSLPLCLVMAAMAPQLIEFVYGDEWTAAAPVLRWLAGLAALRIFFELAYDYLVVVQRTPAILVIQVAGILSLVPALMVGIPWKGVDGAAAAVLLASIAITLPMYLAEFRRGGITPASMGSAVAWPMGVTLAGTACIVGLARLIDGALLDLLMAGAVGGVLVAALIWLCRDDLRVWRTPADTDPHLLAETP